MTITATYNGDLSRVQLSLVSLTDGLWTVERSRNSTLWETVRGGAALTVAAGGAALDDYEFDPDVVNYYRISPLDPAPGMQLPGVVTAYASTPDHASLDITGDLDVRVLVKPNSWTPGVLQTLVAKYDITGNQRSFLCRVNGTGFPNLVWSADGTALTGNVTCSAAIPLTADELALRWTLDVNNGAAGRVVTFYTGPTLEGPWTQLGSNAPVAGVTSIFASSAPVTVGAWLGGGGDPLAGMVRAAQVRNGIGGTVVANPDFTVHNHATTGFVDSAGRTWTVNGTALVLGGQSTTITPSLGGRVWLKSIQWPFLNRWIDVVNWGDITRAARTGVFAVKGRSVPVSVHDLRGSSEFTLVIATRDRKDFSFDAATEARDLDLMLAAGGPMFIHVPNGSRVPGGYVAIGDVPRQKLSENPAVHQEFTLPCTVVAKPAPEIVGTTMTWRTVERLYGSWQQLLASNPTWADLVTLVGSPDDLVVL